MIPMLSVSLMARSETRIVFSGQPFITDYDYVFFVLLHMVL